jgi:hypothetical protein
MAKANYSEASEVKTIAEQLVPKYHQHILDYSLRIDYVFTDKVPKKGGKEVWGYVQKITNLNAYIAKDNKEGDPFFVMVIAEAIWDRLSPKGKEALIDHELYHIGVKVTEKDDEEVVKLILLPHDMEEFDAINRRYGRWQDSEAINPSETE